MKASYRVGSICSIGGDGRNRCTMFIGSQKYGKFHICRYYGKPLKYHCNYPVDKNHGMDNVDSHTSTENKENYCVAGICTAIVQSKCSYHVPFGKGIEQWCVHGDTINHQKICERLAANAEYEQNNDTEGNYNGGV